MKITTLDESGPRPAGALQAIVLLLCSTLAVMASAALAPGLPQLHAAFADVPGEDWLVPMIITLPGLCLIIGSPIAGALGDRFGRRTLLIWGLCVYAVIGMAPLVLDTLPAILISRVGVGFAEAIALTLSTTLISDYFSGKDRDRWLGYQAAVASISAIMFVGITGILGTYGWRAPFLLYALPLLFAVLVAVFTWEPERREQTLSQTPAAAFNWRPMLPLLAVTLFGSITFYIAQIQGGVALAASGLRDPATIGMLIGAAGLGTLAGAIGFRFICEQPVARLLAGSFLLCAIGYAVVGLANDHVQVAVGMFVAQCGCGILLPSMLTAAVRPLAADVRGRGTGLWQGVFSVGQFLSPLSVTLAARGTGDVLSAFAVIAAANLVAALVAGAVMLKRPDDKRAATASPLH